MSAKHTPGPWFVRRQVPAGPAASTDAGGCFQILDNEDPSNAVVLCVRNPFPGREDEMVANARLMAAAPELLDELQKAHRLLQLALKHMGGERQSLFAEESERLGLGTEGATRFHERAAVIAKATGEQQ